VNIPATAVYIYSKLSPMPGKCYMCIWKCVLHGMYLLLLVWFIGNEAVLFATFMYSCMNVIFTCSFSQFMLHLYLMHCRSHRIKICQAGHLVLLHLVIMAAVMVG